jgi:hypothetical protein
MQQVYRRKLLALDGIAGAETVDLRCEEFIRSVLAGPIETRPDTEGVKDVLLSIGVSADSTARFVDAYHAAVWGSSTVPV